jgi:CDP-diacylglycerol---serine O-phosphatidyltransferase
LHRRNPVRRAAERLEDLSIGKLVPSALTLGGLCSGATAIKFALSQQWRAAVAAIVCAGLFDALDGRAARLLGADSRFGAQLDSLADLVSFGIAPAVVLYIWSLGAMGAGGWIAALIFCTCCAIRLARFNIESLRDEGATPANPYFAGLPTPGAAAVVLLPVLLSFEFHDPAIRNPWFCAVLIAITAPLMVSRLPTPSVKYMRLPRAYRLPAAAFFGLLIALAIYRPWATLIAALLLYLASIPVGITFGEVHRHAIRRRPLAPDEDDED